LSLIYAAKLRFKPSGVSYLTTAAPSNRRSLTFKCSATAGEAFERARSAIDWLLEHTRPNAKASMLYDENIVYGFNRNLYGLKPIAITLAIVAIASHATLLALFQPDNQALWIGIAIGIFIFVFGLYWIFGVTRRAVEDASLAYAQRLFSQCEALAKQPAKKSESKSVSEATGAG
jgi:hypothetical protein